MQSHGEYREVCTHAASAEYDEYNVPPLVGLALILQVGKAETGVWGDMN